MILRHCFDKKRNFTKQVNTPFRTNILQNNKTLSLEQIFYKTSEHSLQNKYFTKQVNTPFRTNILLNK